MKKTSPVNYYKVLAVFVVISLGSMLLINVAISNSQREKILANEEARANSEISLVGAMVIEPLLRYQFDYIEQFVGLWGAGNNRITSLEALSRDGVILASYTSKEPFEHPLRVEKKVFFEEKHLLTIKMVVNMTDIMENLASLEKGLYLQSFLVSMAITLLLMMTLKVVALRPLENEINLRTRAEEELQGSNKALVNTIEEQKKAEKMLALEKEQWERTVDAIPDLIALVDRSHKIVRINKALASAMGMDSKEAVGRRFCLAGSDEQNSDRPCREEYMLESLESLSSEVYVKGLDGYYDINVMPYHGADGEVEGTVFVAHDVGERMIAEQEKDKLKSDLLHAQKLESVGRLAAGIAHEINTPIQYITTNVHFMEDAFEDTRKLVEVFMGLLEEAKKVPSLKDVAGLVDVSLEDVDWEFLVEELPETIKQSEEGLSRVATIVSAMKEFSHPGGKHKEATNLNRIIVTTVAVARNEWKYVADVETHFDESLPEVHCLADEIGQVLLNLLINAGHSIAEKLGENVDQEKGRIKIETFSKDGWAEVRIGDNGMGIPESMHYKIFDPFFTTKDVGKGTGQGLSIAHDVITQKHKGTLTFETEEGKGTTFIVRIPLEG